MCLSIHPYFVYGGKDAPQGYALKAIGFVSQLPSCPTTWEDAKECLSLWGGHLIRAFLRIFKDRNQPTAVLFIDLQEAFYRVIRPLALSGHWDDAHIASLAARLHLDHHIMHDLKEHLLEASAIDLAGMKGVAKRAIRALHTDTFFALPDNKTSYVRVMAPGRAIRLLM